MTEKSNPIISVILPVFNGENYLYQCINSVINQSMYDFELLIGDDYSSDKSRQIIESFSDSRIKTFFGKENEGLFKNLNQLIKSTAAPLIRILCQDDILEKNCLDEEVKFFDKHPQIGMSFCKAYLINKQGDTISKGALNDMPDVLDPSLSAQCFFYFGCLPGNLSTVCVRRDSFERAGLFDESYQVAADYEMWVRICRYRKLGVLHNHLVRLRLHRGQLSRSSSSGTKFIFEQRKLRSQLLSELPKEIKYYASIHQRFRQDVIDTHYCIKSLISGRFKDFFRIVKLMGIGNFMFNVILWILTLNNHLYKPRPRFINTEKR